MKIGRLSFGIRLFKTKDFKWFYRRQPEGEEDV